MTTHFVGIGGAGMSSLAAIELESGQQVSGCDLKLNRQTEWLASRGARIYEGHSPQHLGGVEQVIVTGPAAMTTEVQEARHQGIPVMKRAELLGKLMDSRRGIAVAGTHGKTTTTALVASILIGAGCDPTALVGGVPTGWESGGRYGLGEWMVAEADEYDRSFLYLHPEVAVLTGIDMDHPDIYADLGAVEQAFREFLAGVKPKGIVLASAVSPRAVHLAETMGRVTGFEVETYGSAVEADWQYRVSSRSSAESELEIRHGGVLVGTFSTPLAGAYNLDNVTGAIAAALHIGASVESARTVVTSFGGVARRFELKGEAGGVTIVDEYAHHPTAVRAALRAARDRYPGRRIWVAFQPHTYSRTRVLMSEFAEALSDADRVFLLDIYAAREQPDPEVTSQRLAQLIGTDAATVGDVRSAVEHIAMELQPGVVLLTMGAGDVTEVGPMVLRRLGAR